MQKEDFLVKQENGFQDCSYEIISAFYEVHKKIGPGFLENAYHNALFYALKKRGLEVESEKEYTLKFDDHIVGEYRADLVVNNEVIVEVKAVSKLLPIHKAQLISYLRVSGLPIGLLVNFSGESVVFKRLVN